MSEQAGGERVSILNCEILTDQKFLIRDSHFLIIYFVDGIRSRIISVSGFPDAK